MYNDPSVNLPEGYSGVTRQQMENIFAQNRDGSFSFITEPQDIPAQNLPPKIETNVEPQQPQFIFFLTSKFIIPSIIGFSIVKEVHTIPISIT